MDVIGDLEKIDRLCEQALVASETAVETPTPFTTQNLGVFTQTISDPKRCLDDDDIEEVTHTDISKVIDDGGKHYDPEKIDAIRREIDETAVAGVNRKHVDTNSSLERRESSERGLTISIPLTRLPSGWQHTSPRQQHQPRRHASPAQTRPPTPWKTSEWPGVQPPTASSSPCLISSGEGTNVKPHAALSSQPGCSWWKDDTSAPPACESTATPRTIPVSPMTESVKTQGKDSNTFSIWDDNACMSAGTSRRSSLTSQLYSSNTMVTSTEISCLESTSPDSPKEDSGATQGDDSNSTDEWEDMYAETLMVAYKGSMIPFSPVSPGESSMAMLEAEFNSIKIETNDCQFPRVVNRTDIIFSEEDSILLNKSLKLIIEPVFDWKIAVELIVVAMSAIELGKLKQHEQWRVGYKLWKIIHIELNKLKEGMVNQKSRVYQSVIESVNKKLSEGKAVARKAAKGDFIEIVREEKYIEETLSYFKENNIVEIPYDITDESTSNSSNKDGELFKDEKKKVSTPYYGEMSKKLEKIFKSYNVKFAFQTKNVAEYSLRGGVGVRKRKFEQAGVYKIKCASCSAIYIGQTSRTFLTRYKEHMDACRLGHVEKSCIAEHMIEKNHQLTAIENDLEVLHIEEEASKRDTLEKFEITIHNHRFGGALLNKQIGDTQNRFFDAFVELFLYYVEP